MTKKKIIIAGLLVAMGLTFQGHQEEKIANLEKTIDNQSNEVYNRDITIQELNRKLIEQQKVIDDLALLNDRLEEEREVQEVSRGGGRQIQVKVTHYSAEETGSSITASGKEGTPFLTLAYNGLPLGSHVRIDGREYVVEDRCGIDGVADIYVNSTAEALSLGSYYTTMEVLD